MSRKGVYGFLGRAYLIGLIILSMIVYFIVQELSALVIVFLTGAVLFFAISHYIMLWNRRRIYRSGILELDIMKNQDFMNLMYKYFEQHGYKMDLTDDELLTEDDMMLERDSENTFARIKKKIHSEEIEEVESIVDDENHVVKGIVATTKDINYETELDDLKIWDRDRIISLLSKVNGRKMILDTVQCVRCGSGLIEKHKKFETVVGCPKCNWYTN